LRPPLGAQLDNPRAIFGSSDSRDLASRTRPTEVDRPLPTGLQRQVRQFLPAAWPCDRPARGCPLILDGLCLHVLSSFQRTGNAPGFSPRNACRPAFLTGIRATFQLYDRNSSLSIPLGPPKLPQTAPRASSARPDVPHSSVAVLAVPEQLSPSTSVTSPTDASGTARTFEDTPGRARCQLLHHGAAVRPLGGF